MLRFSRCGCQPGLQSLVNQRGGGVVPEPHLRNADLCDLLHVSGQSRRSLMLLPMARLLGSGASSSLPNRLGDQPVRVLGWVLW